MISDLVLLSILFLCAMAALYAPVLPVIIDHLKTFRPGHDPELMNVVTRHKRRV